LQHGVAGLFAAAGAENFFALTPSEVENGLSRAWLRRRGAFRSSPGADMARYRRGNGSLGGTAGR